MAQLLRTLVAPGETFAFLEEVSGFIGKARPGSRMFAFGRNFGFVVGFLQAMNVRTELVRPQKWQKPLGIGTAAACASRTVWKNKLKAQAQRLHPNLKPTLKTADALLILGFGLKSLAIR